MNKHNDRELVDAENCGELSEEEFAAAHPGWDDGDEEIKYDANGQPRMGGFAGYMDELLAMQKRNEDAAGDGPRAS